MVDCNDDEQSWRGRGRWRTHDGRRSASRRRNGRGQQGQKLKHSRSPLAGHQSLARNRSLTICGLALPAIAFITWPTKKPNSASLPLLYCATLSALAAITSSAAASIAPVSD